jgi:membrane glycosyltransferase
VAVAKLNDAVTIDEAVEWLKPRERMIVLHDRSLIDMLARLKTVETAPEEVGA